MASNVGSSNENRLTESRLEWAAASRQPVLSKDRFIVPKGITQRMTRYQTRKHSRTNTKIPQQLQYATKFGVKHEQTHVHKQTHTKESSNTQTLKNLHGDFARDFEAPVRRIKSITLLRRRVLVPCPLLTILNHQPHQAQTQGRQFVQCINGSHHTVANLRSRQQRCMSRLRGLFTLSVLQHNAGREHTTVGVHAASR
jgi:hypothetical protein